MLLAALVTGLVTGLTLIIAIGAQNAYVLRQGLAREHVGLVVAICTVSDIVLIAAGIGGIGTIVEQAPWVITAVRWFGVAFLAWYGVSTLLRARRPEALEASDRAVASPRRVAARAVALTWLNPHVYLDTVLLLGAIANQQDGGRWWFGLGAMAGSVLWFTGLGFGARRAHRLLASPRSWQVLDLLIGLTMLALAVRLATGH